MTMISDLPKDLESEILSRVPAKSLWELKTTCKRWYALFRDRIAGGDLLLQNNNNGSIELTGKLTSLKCSKDLNISEIFQCDGLMLCSVKSELVVWNPCTGQTRSIKPRTCYCYDDAYALGYTTSSSGGHRSYRILRRYYSQNDKKVVLGEIYDLSSDSWRVLDDYFPPLGYSVNRNGVCLKGDAYFVAPRDKVNDAFLITKFDFTTETLVRLPLPFKNLHPWDKAFLSVVRDEKIALLHVFETEGSMRILVTNKIDDDEAKDLSWRSDVALGIDCYKHNLYFESFLFDEENKVAVLSCAAHLRRKFLTRIYVADEYIYV
ncbi:putative F-box/kelch-repeat protein At3g17540 [Brassica napus]|uniref:putative F-box/kelch-repeat protein At3g17540 n=1 Tax=Brassica napus TaxID=3708 RepID=UPI000BBE4695|nr:putative F-box/kelch-repeat protein At3g17540 [Brassica napus]